MTLSQKSAPATMPGMSSALLARLATLAALGMVYYLAAGIVLHLLRPDYSLLKSGMSCYAVGPYGLLETIAFILDGLSIAALTIGLYRGVSLKGRSRAGLALLALVGAGRILEAIFPTDVPPGPVPRTPVGVTHFFVAFGVFIGVVAAVLILSGRLGQDPAWHGFQRVAKGLALASLAAVVAFFGTVLVVGLFPQAPVDLNVAGLVEKIFLALWHSWILLAALHLRSNAIAR